MATLATTNPTLVDLAKRLDPDGSIAMIAEILNQTNEMLDDIPWIEGNLPTGHRSTVRTGLPTPTWRKLYGGVQPAKSTTAQVTDNTGMLEAYAEVDKALADLNGNTQAFRLSEDRAFIEGISEELQRAVIYASEGSNPEQITGLDTRFNLTTAGNGSNIIKGGGSGSDNTSIWLVVWGPGKVHGIYPKGSKAGLSVQDKGQVTIENADGSGGRMEAYRTHYKWDCGLAVPDWRYVVRICNIDSSDLVKDAASGADLLNLMQRALYLPPNLNGTSVAFYANRRIQSFIGQQALNKTNAFLTLQNLSSPSEITRVATPLFMGVPVRRCDKITIAEATIS
jgi:hypothetical protein